MSAESRVALLLGAMEEVFLSHVETLSGIYEILDRAPEEEKGHLDWTLGWNMARMQESLEAASSALCREMNRLGLEAPTLNLQVSSPPDGPEEFIPFWIDHLIGQAAIIRLSYNEIQERVLSEPEKIDDQDNFWDESLKDLLS